MRIVLNEFTETAHKPSHEAQPQPAYCGALRHVSDDHIRVISGSESELRDGFDRCGRCFEGPGGY